MPTKANSVRSEPRLVARQSRSGSTAAQLTKIRTKANFRHPSKVRITRIQNQTQFPARVGQAPHRTATPSAEFKTKPISVPVLQSHGQKFKTKPNSPRAGDVPLETRQAQNSKPNPISAPNPQRRPTDATRLVSPEPLLYPYAKSWWVGRSVPAEPRLTRRVRPTKKPDGHGFPETALNGRAGAWPSTKEKLSHRRNATACGVAGRSLALFLDHREPPGLNHSGPACPNVRRLSR